MIFVVKFVPKNMRKVLFVILVLICSENVFGFLFGFGKFNLTRELFAPLRQEATARSHDYYNYNQIGVSDWSKKATRDGGYHEFANYI